MRFDERVVQVDEEAEHIENIATRRDATRSNVMQCDVVQRDAM
jgi:hypothetical protein